MPAIGSQRRVTRFYRGTSPPLSRWPSRRAGPLRNRAPPSAWTSPKVLPLAPAPSSAEPLYAASQAKRLEGPWALLVFHTPDLRTSGRLGAGFHDFDTYSTDVMFPAAVHDGSPLRSERGSFTLWTKGEMASLVFGG